MTGTRPIERGVLSDQVKDHLLQEILAGRLAPGARIVETRLARDLGVSQAPVREALRDLEALGVVEISPFRGARVRHPGAAELLEAYAIRAELESMAARLLLPRLTPDDIAELRGYLREMQGAAGGGDPHASAIADVRFHALVVDRCGNATLARLWRHLEPLSRTYITLVVPGADLEIVAELHTPILSALERGDADEVTAAYHEHFETAGRRFVGSWVDDGPPPEPVHLGRGVGRLSEGAVTRRF